jgi:Protein of unknown function (DUF3187)
LDLAKIWAKRILGESRGVEVRLFRFRHLPLSFLALFGTLRAAAQQPSFGPLTTEEGAPLQRISYTPMVEGSDVVAPGEVTTDLWLGYSNIFEQDSSATHVLFMDTERLLTVGTVRWGVRKGLELGGRFTFETTGPGFLDSFVLWYHNLLGFGQANRDRYPRNRYEELLTNGKQTVYIDAPQSAFRLDDVRVFAKWRATASADGRSVLSLKTEAWIPTRSTGVANERSDVALMALGRLGVGSWYLHGMAGAATVRASPELAPVMRSWSTFLMIGAERSLGSSLAGVVEYQISSPILRGFHHRELDWPSSNLLFGVAGRRGAKWTWDVGFQEDVPADTPSVDFTLGLRVSRAWR